MSSTQLRTPSRAPSPPPPPPPRLQPPRSRHCHWLALLHQTAALPLSLCCLGSRRHARSRRSAASPPPARPSPQYLPMSMQISSPRTRSDLEEGLVVDDEKKVRFAVQGARHVCKPKECQSWYGGFAGVDDFYRRSSFFFHPLKESSSQSNA